MDTKSKTLKVLIIIVLVFFIPVSLINLIWGSGFPEGPELVFPRMDNTFRFDGGDVLGVSIIIIFLLSMIQTKQKIFFFLGLTVFLGGCYRIISGLQFGWPQEPLYLFNTPVFLVYTIPCFFEITVGAAIMIVQYLRSREAGPLVSHSKEKLDTHAKLLRIMLIIVFVFFITAGLLVLVHGSIIPLGPGVFGPRMDNIFRFSGGIATGVAILYLYMAISIREHHRILYPFGILLLCTASYRIVSGVQVGWPTEPSGYGNVPAVLAYTIPCVFEFLIGLGILIVQNLRNKKKRASV